MGACFHNQNKLIRISIQIVTEKVTRLEKNYPVLLPVSSVPMEQKIACLPVEVYKLLLW